MVKGNGEHTGNGAHTDNHHTDRYRQLNAVDDAWLGFCERVGFDVTRTSDAFVSYDGEHSLNIAPAGDLDPDDSVAALALHELCHLAVRGDAGFDERDWGLTYLAEGDLSDEYAALRLQRWLASSAGLQELLHPTTEHRPYYDALATVDSGGSTPWPALDDPRFVGQDERARALATRGRRWLTSQPWWPELCALLRRTAETAETAETGSGVHA